MRIKITLIKSLLFLILQGNILELPAQTGQWSAETSNEIIHRHENAFTESGGKFYLLGGRKLGVEKFTNIYDPATKTWGQGTNKSPIELHHFQAVTYNQLIYIICAFTGNYPDETPTSKIYVYNPSNDSWSEGSDIPAARRRGSAAAVVHNNKIYLIGGLTNGHQHGSVNWLDEYDPQTNTWTPLPDAPRARDHFQAAVADNKILLAGGRTTSLSTGHLNDLVVDEVDAFDFSKNSWETWPNKIPTGRAGTSAGVIGNELIVIGGEGPNATAAHKETEALNFSTKSWRRLSDLNTGRHASQAISYNNRIYIAAGSSQRGGNASTELTSMETFSLEVSGATRATDPELINITTFPNPVADLLTIEGSNVHLNWTLFDACGKITKNSSEASSGQIDFSALEKGFYILKIYTANIATGKSIKIIKN